jgi:hypothetical protein
MNTQQPIDSPPNPSCQEKMNLVSIKKMLKKEKMKEKRQENDKLKLKNLLAHFHKNIKLRNKREATKAIANRKKKTKSDKEMEEWKIREAKRQALKQEMDKLRLEALLANFNNKIRLREEKRVAIEIANAEKKAKWDKERVEYKIRIAARRAARREKKKEAIDKIRLVKKAEKQAAKEQAKSEKEAAKEQAKAEKQAAKEQAKAEKQAAKEQAKSEKQAENDKYRLFLKNMDKEEKMDIIVKLMSSNSKFEGKTQNEAFKAMKFEDWKANIDLTKGYGNRTDIIVA